MLFIKFALLPAFAHLYKRKWTKKKSVKSEKNHFNDDEQQNLFLWTCLAIYTPSTIFELFLLFFFNTSLLLLLRRTKIWEKIITDKSALISSHTEWMRERKRNFGGCWQHFRLMTSCSDGTLVVVHVHLFGLYSAPVTKVLSRSHVYNNRFVEDEKKLPKAH